MIVISLEFYAIFFWTSKFNSSRKCSNEEGVPLHQQFEHFCHQCDNGKFQDETRICKNWLQKTMQKTNVFLLIYTTVCFRLGHLPVFTSFVEVTSMTFLGDIARTKKQTKWNVAMAAWSPFKQCKHMINSSLSRCCSWWSCDCCCY